MKLLISALAAAALIGYYFLIFKPKQDAKISKKTKGKGAVAPPTDADNRYSEIIDDYPTFHRNQQN